MNDVGDIIEAYLKDNGFDGLYRPDDCGCLLGDLMPCGEPQLDCAPGYKTKCKKGNEYDWVVSPDKNPPEDPCENMEW